MDLKEDHLLKLLFLLGNRSKYMLRKSILHHVPIFIIIIIIIIIITITIIIVIIIIDLFFT